MKNEKLTILLLLLFINQGTVIAQNTNEIYVNSSENTFDIHYDLIWEKSFNGKIQDVDISGDGKIIAVTDGIIDSGRTNLKTNIFYKNGETIWSTGGDYFYHALSPEGNCLALPSPKMIFVFPNSIETPLWVEDKGGNSYSWYADVSSDCELFSIIDMDEYKTILIDKEGKKLWSYQMLKDNTNKGGSISISDSGNYILSSTAQGIYLLDNNGNLLWEKKADDFSFRYYYRSSISPNGKFIAIGGDNVIYLFGINGTELNRFRFNIPENKKIGNILVTNSGIIAFYDGNPDIYKESSVYLMDKNGSLIWKNDLNNPITSMAISSYGYQMLIGTENGELYYFADPSKTSFEKTKEIEYVIEKEIEKENPMNKNFIILGASAFLIISIFVIFPYYKRTKAKREMAKTPSDWCPHCHKFTGGVYICPHCGQNTFIEIKYTASQKEKKK